MLKSITLEYGDSPECIREFWEEVEKEAEYPISRFKNLIVGDIVNPINFNDGIDWDWKFWDRYTEPLDDDNNKELTIKYKPFSADKVEITSISLKIQK